MKKSLTVISVFLVLVASGATNTTAAAKRLFDEIKVEKNPFCMAFIANKGFRTAHPRTGHTHTN